MEEKLVEDETRMRSRRNLEPLESFLKDELCVEAAKGNEIERHYPPTQ